MYYSTNLALAGVVCAFVTDGRHVLRCLLSLGHHSVVLLRVASRRTPG